MRFYPHRHFLDRHKHYRAEERPRNDRSCHPDGTACKIAEYSQFCKNYRSRIEQDMKDDRRPERSKLLIQIRQEHSQQERIDHLRRI